MLGPRGEHELQLAVGIHALVLRVQQQAADRLAQRRASRLASHDQFPARRRDGLLQIFHVGGLADPLDTFNGDKHARHITGPFPAG